MISDNTPISLVDSHCHIPMIETEGGTEAILTAARENQVDRMLCVCIDVESYGPIRELASQHNNIYSSIGIHPNTLLNKEITIEELLGYSNDHGVIAIGETGLDYFRSEGQQDWQLQRFRDHIRAARDCGKPLIVHCREASEDVIRILREERADEVGGIMHCFVEDLETAQRAMDLNFYISFSGIVTFKNARDLQAVAREIPDNALLVETDSPYLAPVPYRGKLNQPAYVRHVAEFLADLRGSSLSHIANITTENFDNLFNISNS